MNVRILRSHAVLTLVLALSISGVLLVARDSLAVDTFKILKKHDAVAAPAPVKKNPAAEQDLLLKNQKLVSNMRAFRKAPPELKSLVAAIVTNSQRDTLLNLNVRSLPAYRVLRSNLNATSLTAIEGAIMQAKGANFKAALTILVATLVRDKAVPLDAKQKLVSLLADISLTPYRFGDRHQFVAYVALSHHLDRAQYSSFAHRFFNAHKRGKDHGLQIAIYRDAMQMLKEGPVKPLYLEGTRTVRPEHRARFAPQRKSSGSRVMSHTDDIGTPEMPSQADDEEWQAELEREQNPHDCSLGNPQGCGSESDYDNLLPRDEPPETPAEPAEEENVIPESDESMRIIGWLFRVISGSASCEPQYLW